MKIYLLFNEGQTITNIVFFLPCLHSHLWSSSLLVIGINFDRTHLFPINVFFSWVVLPLFLLCSFIPLFSLVCVISWLGATSVFIRRLLRTMMMMMIFGLRLINTELILHCLVSCLNAAHSTIVWLTSCESWCPVNCKIVVLEKSTRLLRIEMFHYRMKVKLQMKAKTNIKIYSVIRLMGKINVIWSNIWNKKSQSANKKKKMDICDFLIRHDQFIWSYSYSFLLPTQVMCGSAMLHFIFHNHTLIGYNRQMVWLKPSSLINDSPIHCSHNIMILHS